MNILFIVSAYMSSSCLGKSCTDKVHHFMPEILNGYTIKQVVVSVDCYIVESYWLAIVVVTSIVTRRAIKAKIIVMY